MHSDRMLTLRRPGDASVLHGATTDAVAVFFTGDCTADGDLKYRFLVRESCFPISIRWAHDLFCSAEY